MHFDEFLCCAFANIYILPLFAGCVMRIGHQVAHLGPWQSIYNYRGKSLCLSEGTA